MICQNICIYIQYIHFGVHIPIHSYQPVHLGKQQNHPQNSHNRLGIGYRWMVQTPINSTQVPQN